MNRRSFLKLLGFSFIAPKVAIEVLNKPPDKPPKIDGGRGIRNPLFKGSLEEWNGIVIHTTARENLKKWKADTLDRDVFKALLSPTKALYAGRYK